MIPISPRTRRVLDRGLRVGFVVAVVLFAILRPVPAGDAHAYWAVNLADPYSRPVATQDAFTYPPPAALVFAVLGQLPWEVFQALWTILIGLVLLWLVGPWAVVFLALPVVSSDLYLGNIHVLLAGAIVGSLRRPWLWAIPLLTKPTCGLGLLWLAARGEWRRLGVAIGATAVLVAGSLVIAPGLWPAWISYVLATGPSPDLGNAWWIPIPLLIRLPVAAGLVVWGARTNRAWTLPAGAMLALPVLWLVGLAMLAGSFALSPWGPRRKDANAGAPSTGVRLPRTGSVEVTPGSL
jgi:Glycosyltransferase family 87